MLIVDAGNKAIGVHYDQIFLRYGEDTAVTAWVPIGDIKIHGGGLIYLENGMSITPRRIKTEQLPGHKLGAEIEEEFTEKAKAAGLSEEEAKFAFNRNMMHGMTSLA